MKKSNVIAFCSVVVFSSAIANSYDDCILQSMKGVASDAAARMVAQGCKNKYSAEQAARKIQFGDELDYSQFKLYVGETETKNTTDGYLSQRLENLSNSVITYVALEVRDVYQQDFRAKNDFSERDGERTRIFYYKVQINPGKVGNLKFRVKSNAYMTKIISARAVPQKWSDSLTAVVKSDSYIPQTQDPLTE